MHNKADLLLQLETATLVMALSSHFKLPVGSEFNAISRLSVEKWRCLLSSCCRMVRQEGGMAVCRTTEEEAEEEMGRCPH